MTNLNSENLLTSPEQKKLETISSTLFDVDFTSAELTDEDNEILKACVTYVNQHTVCFHAKYDSDRKEILPVAQLLKLRNKSCDVIVYMCNSVGQTIGTVVYKQCNVSVNFDDFLSFSSSFGLDFPDPKELSISMCPSSITYNGIEI